jgi:hypothetical protein
MRGTEARQELRLDRAAPATGGRRVDLDEIPADPGKPEAPAFRSPYARDRAYCPSACIFCIRIRKLWPQSL